MTCLKFNHPLQFEQVPAITYSGQPPAVETVKT